MSVHIEIHKPPPAVKVRHFPAQGKLAAEAGFCLPLQVLQSQAGFYIGTADEAGPVSRESTEYFPTEVAAQLALAHGEWTQRPNP